jgi:hypothetical protein
VAKDLFSRTRIKENQSKMGFRRFNRRSNFIGKNRRVLKPNGALTKNFQSKVIRVTQFIQPRQRLAAKSDPTQYNARPTWTRRVRIDIAATATGVTYKDILDTIATDYGQAATVRLWREVKILSFKAYGAVDVSRMQIQVTNATATSEGNGTTFTDYSDLNHRSVISVVMPTSTVATGTGSMLTFNAGDVDVIDFWCELSTGD